MSISLERRNLVEIDRQIVIKRNKRKEVRTVSITRRIENKVNTLKIVMKALVKEEAEAGID